MAGEQVRVTGTWPGTWVGFTQQVGGLLDAGVFAIDCSFAVTEWNPWMERVTGLRAADVIGQQLDQVDPHLRSNTRAAFERALGGAAVVLSQQLHGYVIDVKPPAGHEDFPRMQQSARIVPLYDDADTVLGAVAIVYDVTERVARERDLRAAMEAAQAADRAKSDFLAAMSHELRTPIGAMSGYADLLAGEVLGPVSDTQREHLLRIKSVAAHLLGIVDEILTFARMQADRERVHVTDCNAAAVCEEAILAVEPLAARKNLRVVRQLPEAPIQMRSDDAKIRQILINLMGNAVKFTSTGTITVEVAPTADGKRVEFRVSDTGVGIAPDDLSRVFEPFVQVRRDRLGSAGGTGLGLAVSRDLARMLGGYLTVMSEVGVGTTFMATLAVDAAQG